MKIIPIASSSTGNCYVIESNRQKLIIDCGVPIKRIREKIGTFENVVACLVSHEHGDHAGYIDQLRRQTVVPIYYGFMDGETYNFGPFKIMALRLIHDVICNGFLILTKTEKLFYATDTSSIPYTFPGLTHLMIEANFSWDLIAGSDLSDPVINRTINNHLDIDSAIEFIKLHPSLQEIWLLHLSDRHSNAEDFKRRVIDATGVIVNIAPK